MPEYLRTDVVARAEALGLKARQLVEGLRVGEHKSPYRGFSVEFVQHREYVPGDDIRHIDWKSYGRSERYTIKQYEQETNFTAHVLLDSSNSMLYGDGDANKLEYAKVFVAALSYMIVKQRDTVSFAAFDSTWRVQLPPSSQTSHLQVILREMESLQPREKTSIGPLLRQLADKVRRKGLVFLISDCFDDVPELVKGLRAIRFLGHEVVVCHVMHGDELEFPFDGNVRFDGLEEAEHLRTRPQSIRPAYQRVVTDYLQELRTACDAARIDYLMLDTTKPLGPVLATYLANRLARGRA